MIDLKKNNIRTRPPLSESINKNLEESSSKEVLKENINYSKDNKKMSKFVKILISLLAIFFIASAGFAGYYYKKVKDLTRNESVLKDAKLNEVIEKVGRLVVLPQGEQPTLATVSDPAQLQNQPFFKSAKKGDIVLVYINARRAILYDPVADKVIDIAPLNVSNPVDMSTLPQNTTNTESSLQKTTNTTTKTTTQTSTKKK